VDLRNSLPSRKSFVNPVLCILPRLPNIVRWSWIVLTLIASIHWAVPAQASSNGISGFSGMNGSTCTSCHSGSTSQPTVTLMGPTSVASGSTNSYTISVSVISSGNGGVDVAASAGAFAAGTGTKVFNGEIVHSAPSSTHSWTFSWTAPTVTATTTATLYAAAIDSYGGGTGTIKQAITVNAAAPVPTINVSPATLSFNYQSGGSVPPSQNVAVSSSGTAFNYNVSTSATWLTATPTSGSTPGSVAVSVAPGSLAAGTYTGTVSISSATASNSPKTVAVTLTVTAAALPTISTSPASLNFTYQIGSSTPASQTVAIASSGSAVNFTTATSATWLSATPASGITPGNVAVSINPSGLAAGSYTGNVTINSAGASNSPKSIAVSLTVTSAPVTTLTVSPANLSFAYQTGGAVPASQPINVTSTSALAYTATSSGSWLSVTPASGNTPGSLTASVNPSGLAAGSYSGTITVTATGASNSPQKVAVSLTVTAPAGNPSLNISPGTVSFSYPVGSTTAGTQKVSVASSGSALNVNAVAAGGAWLSVTPASGSTPATLTVTANPSGLAAGTYNGTVTVTSSGASNTPQTIPVTLVITTSTGTGKLRVWPPRAAYFEYESGHPMPSPRSIRVTSTGSPLSFTAAAHGGTWLSVTPSGGTTPGSLSISVDPTGLASGTYSGTIAIYANGAAGVNLPVVLKVASGDDGGGGDDGGSDDASNSGDGLRAWPFSYDPASSNSVAASWMDNTGVSSSAGNNSDMRNQGLLLSKTSAASNQAQAGVVIRDVEGMSVTELGYDIRNGGQCTATTPRFAVVTTDDVVHKAGCAAGTSQPSPGAGWKRLRFDPANPAQMNPPVAPGSKVKSVYVLMDGGPETGASIVVLDNVDINGKIIGKQ
jgi:BACON domain-containing protein